MICQNRIGVPRIANIHHTLNTWRINPKISIFLSVKFVSNPNKIFWSYFILLVQFWIIHKRIHINITLIFSFLSFCIKSKEQVPIYVYCSVNLSKVWVRPALYEQVISGDIEMIYYNPDISPCIVPEMHTEATISNTDVSDEIVQESIRDCQQ